MATFKSNTRMPPPEFDTSRRLCCTIPVKDSVYESGMVAGRYAQLGTHGNITPDLARDMARSWAAEVAKGGDPAGDKTEARLAPTVKDLMETFLADHMDRKNKASTAENVRRMVEKTIVPALGKLKVGARSTIAVRRTADIANGIAIPLGSCCP